LGLTFEKVWAMFQESDRRMRKLSEETDRQMRETDQQIRETGRQIDEMLGNRFGALYEYMVSPNIVQKFSALGFHFDEISSRRKAIVDEGDGQKIAEFDIVLENGEIIIGVAVKSKQFYDDVGDHEQRLRILRLVRNKKGDKRKIYGALAGAIMPSSVRTAALKAGFYVITQTGDTVRIDVPEGFTPKAW
jgi:hypothetical protein